jgi:Mg2+/Co2+ transporter CorB
MTTALMLFFGISLFFVGMRLSAFFSGSETGFYRLSTLQLSLQVQNGDSVARRLRYFVQHPERFVATTLVGNNVANYLTTLAIGICVTTVVTTSTGTVDIVATILLTPVVFIFGELLPTSVLSGSFIAVAQGGDTVLTGLLSVFAAELSADSGCETGVTSE